ncbi:MAG: nicotinate-nucleotide adenylyltransferase [Bacteroidales bacterium]|jgi:nicotinate-nucleotide adenylyltransferase|nr:nicotinate-nucleotide adenylyltransferase [Bacteroidales bacterium]
MNRLKNIGLYFGSFNPVHNGHLQIVRYLFGLEQFDKIWLILSPANPFKCNQELANENSRLEMLNVAFDTFNYVEIKDIELSLSRPSYTYRTLEILTKEYPNCHFSLIMGEDSLVTLPTWKCVEKIIGHFTIYVYPRRGYNADKTLPNVKMVEPPYLDISSTIIRQKIRNKEDVTTLLPPKVWTIIQREKLYGAL